MEELRNDFLDKRFYKTINNYPEKIMAKAEKIYDKNFKKKNKLTKDG